MFPPMMLEALMFEIRHVRPLPWVHMSQEKTSDRANSWWKTSGGDVVYVQTFLGQNDIPNMMLSVLVPNAPCRHAQYTFVWLHVPYRKDSVLASLESSCAAAHQDQLDAVVRRAQALLINAGYEGEWCFEDRLLRSTTSPALEVVLDETMATEMEVLQEQAGFFYPTNTQYAPTFECLNFWPIDVPTSQHARLAFFQKPER